MNAVTAAVQIGRGLISHLGVIAGSDRASAEVRIAALKYLIHFKTQVGKLRKCSPDLLFFPEEGVGEMDAQAETQVLGDLAAQLRIYRRPSNKLEEVSAAALQQLGVRMLVIDAVTA